MAVKIKHAEEVKVRSSDTRRNRGLCWLVGGFDIGLNTRRPGKSNPAILHKRICRYHDKKSDVKFLQLYRNGGTQDWRQLARRLVARFGCEFGSRSTSQFDDDSISFVGIIPLAHRRFMQPTRSTQFYALSGWCLVFESWLARYFSQIVRSLRTDPDFNAGDGTMVRSSP